MKSLINKLMKKFVRWLDPKLDRFRSAKAPTPPYTPKTVADFIGVMKRTPKEVINDNQRNIIAAAMSFKDRKVKEIMLPKDQMTFVYENDYLGPVMLDKLYKSGFEHFPVLDKQKHIVGVIHTESLNSLEIRKTDKASKYLDKNVFYLREDYTLDQALAAFMRTNSFIFMVINKSEELVGLMSFEMMMKFLLGEIPEDGFTKDNSSFSVAKR